MSRPKSKSKRGLQVCRDPEADERLRQQIFEIFDPLTPEEQMEAYNHLVSWWNREKLTAEKRKVGRPEWLRDVVQGNRTESTAKPKVSSADGAKRDAT